MTRPPTPTPGAENARAGYRFVAEPEDTTGWRPWTTDPAIVAGRRCRYGSRWSGYCGRPAVAALDRSRPTVSARWYGYCDDHLYGRWIEDGVVYAWRLRKVTP